MGKINSKSFYEMSKIRVEVEDKLKAVKGNKQIESIYKDQLKIINRCVNSLYL